MKPVRVTAFRRSWWGYNAKEVDLFLEETAAERHRLAEALTRVETLMAEWDCGTETILASARREAAEIRANAERDARSASKPAASRPQIISLNPLQKIPTASEASPPLMPDDGGLGLLPDPITNARTPENAIEILARNRSKRQRRTRRIAGLIATCASVVAILAIDFSGRDTKTSYGEINAQAAANATPRRGQTATRPARNGPTTVTAGQNSTGAPAAPPKTLMLTLSAVKPCWIRTVVDGTHQMERVLQPAETVMLHATDEVLLKVGDAAALSLLINNRPATPLGRSGEVVTRLITRANYSSLLQTEQ